MLINGTFADSIDAADRGLAYGDGLFETVRIAHGRPVLLSAHLQRLREGCELLGIEAPVAELEADIRALMADNGLPHSVIKLIVTRGVSERGYGFESGSQPTRIAGINEYTPDREAGENGIATVLCKRRLGINPGLAGVKHLNRLEQVLATAELSGGYREGLMMNLTDELIEGTKTNLFLVEDGELVTPMLEHCGVKGVMREFLLERMSSRTAPVSLHRLSRCDEVFVCNSVVGIWPVSSLSLLDEKRDEKQVEVRLTWPVGPVTKSARRLVEKETGISG